MFNNLAELYDEFVVSYKVFIDDINEVNADRFLDAAMLLARLAPQNPFRETDAYNLNAAKRPDVEHIVVTAVAE